MEQVKKLFLLPSILYLVLCWLQAGAQLNTIHEQKNSDNVVNIDSDLPSPQIIPPLNDSLFPGMSVVRQHGVFTLNDTIAALQKVPPELVSVLNHDLMNG